jgi:hypothetical protein
VLALLCVPQPEGESAWLRKRRRRPRKRRLARRSRVHRPRCAVSPTRPNCLCKAAGPGTQLKSRKERLRRSGVLSRAVADRCGCGFFRPPCWSTPIGLLKSAGRLAGHPVGRPGSRCFGFADRRARSARQKPSLNRAGDGCAGRSSSRRNGNRTIRTPSNNRRHSGRTIKMCSNSRRRITRTPNSSRRKTISSLRSVQRSCLLPPLSRAPRLRNRVSRDNRPRARQRPPSSAPRSRAPSGSRASHRCV